jgi:predicted kinase
MRNWVRERMRRRGKKTKNESESTGKVGQEKPIVSAHQPAPLQPSYYLGEAEPARAEAAEEAPAPRHHRAEPTEDRMQVLTQPESPYMPPAPPEEILRQPVAPPVSSAQQPAPQEKRAPRGVVVLAIGLPGSGKTTWFKRRGVTPLSSDLLRTILFDDITEQRYQGLVFSTLRSLLRARLIAKMPWNYVDATNLSPHERRQWIKMARSFGYEVQALFFDVPLEVCLDRNRRRERTVNEEIMRRMAEKLRPPSFKEGFSKIVVVRVKKSDTSTDGGGYPQ